MIDQPNPVRAASEILGSQKNLADSLAVDPRFVSQWASGHRKVPAKYCLTIQELTGDKVTAIDLRPDIFLVSCRTG